MTVTDAELLLLLLLAFVIVVALAGFAVWKAPWRDETEDGVGRVEGGDPVFRVKSVAMGAPRLLIEPPRTPPPVSPSDATLVMKKTVKVNPMAPCRVTGKSRTLCRHCQENETHGADH